jgi:MOSC domain-containing protein YiiM
LSGINKQGVDRPVAIGPLGLEADAICNEKHHGGPDQAVYVYGALDYDFWVAALGRALAPGTFGENLTIGGLESTRFSVGDRLHVGAVVLQVTAPRIPCATLAARMGDPRFVKRFRQAERPGLYCRVLQQGVVQAGDAVVVEAYPGPTVTILEMFREFFAPDNRPATLHRYLAAPIAIRDRTEKEARLRALTAAAE